MGEEKSADRATEEFAKSLDQLKAKSQDVKAKIEQEKRLHDLPLDSKLGDPNWEESVADGHLDLPDTEDE
jgi:hypothetical protein